MNRNPKIKPPEEASSKLKALMSLIRTQNESIKSEQGIGRREKVYAEIYRCPICKHETWYKTHYCQMCSKGEPIKIGTSKVRP